MTWTLGHRIAATRDISTNLLIKFNNINEAYQLLAVFSLGGTTNNYIADNGLFGHLLVCFNHFINVKEYVQYWCWL